MDPLENRNAWVRMLLLLDFSSGFSTIIPPDPDVWVSPPLLHPHDPQQNSAVMMSLNMQMTTVVGLIQNDDDKHRRRGETFVTCEDSAKDLWRYTANHG